MVSQRSELTIETSIDVAEPTHPISERPLRAQPRDLTLIQNDRPSRRRHLRTLPSLLRLAPIYQRQRPAVRRRRRRAADRSPNDRERRHLPRRRPRPRDRVVSQSALGDILGEQRGLALLFKKLATVRTDAPPFKKVETLRWRGATPAFAKWAKRMETQRLLERCEKAASL
jgi:hypothetical protein